jgi:hypothetical protein
MAHIFKYAVLMAMPNRLRGERVNVGILVFLNDRLDIRFAELSKIRALAGGEWEAYANDVRQRLFRDLGAGERAEEAIRASPQIDPIIHASDISWLTVRSLDEYEGRIKEILTNLVVRPKDEARPKSTRINTEISQQLKRLKVLAKPEESINDHRVVRDFYVSKEEELIADFALKNGKMHIAATLDLRKSFVRLDEAALKAIILDKAKQKFRKKVNLFGVYAAPLGADQFKPHIELLRDYSDTTYNWLDDLERRELIGAFRKAAALPFEFGGNHA